jgi:hypothetical protein
MIPKIDDKTLGLLSLLLGDFNPAIQAVESSEGGAGNIGRFDLPLARDADYFFRIWFYGDSERQISARLIQSQSDDTYFWHRPFELAEFRGSGEYLINAFCEELKILLTSKTRIVQRNGWLFWHFRCEYCAGEEWKVIYRDSALRGSKFEPPQISGSRRVYQSEAIAPRNTIK